MLSKDAKKKRYQRLLTVVLPICLIGSSVSLSAADSDETEERWFEVEVILYKATSDSGLTNESWDADSPFNLPEELKDFLNPVAPEELQDSLHDLTTDQQKINLINNEDRSNLSKPVNDNMNSSAQLDSDSAPENIEQPLVSEEREKPFILLDNTVLKLQKEAKNISVHPSFRLLAHFAWRQPVAGKSTAIPVRFAGGHDYSEKFEFNGAKKLDIDDHELLSEHSTELEEVVEDNSSTSGISIEPSSNNNRSRQPLGSPAVPENEQNAETSKKALHDNIQPVLLPWVPEIDGTAKVYIYRNYLHLDAALVFRKPGQLEVDIYSIESPLNFEDVPIVAPITPMTDELNTYERPIETNSSPQVFKATEDAEQFAWQFDSDFLNQDTEKVYTEKLFNYPLNQTRRMRSTELHYFDHPKVGMLVLIRPYELDVDGKENIDD